MADPTGEPGGCPPDDTGTHATVQGQQAGQSESRKPPRHEASPHVPKRPTNHDSQASHLRSCHHSHPDSPCPSAPRQPVDRVIHSPTTAFADTCDAERMTHVTHSISTPVLLWTAANDPSESEPAADRDVLPDNVTPLRPARGR